jgi:hypothetical protein
MAQRKFFGINLVDLNDTNPLTIYFYGKLVHSKISFAQQLSVKTFDINQSSNFGDEA